MAGEGYRPKHLSEEGQKIWRGWGDIAVNEEPEVDELMGQIHEAAGTAESWDEANKVAQEAHGFIHRAPVTRAERPTTTPTVRLEHPVEKEPVREEIVEVSLDEPEVELVAEPNFDDRVRVKAEELEQKIGDGLRQQDDAWLEQKLKEMQAVAGSATSEKSKVNVMGLLQVLEKEQARRREEGIYQGSYEDEVYEEVSNEEVSNEANRERRRVGIIQRILKSERFKKVMLGVKIGGAIATIVLAGWSLAASPSIQPALADTVVTVDEGSDNTTEGKGMDMDEANQAENIKEKLEIDRYGYSEPGLYEGSQHKDNAGAFGNPEEAAEHIGVDENDDVDKLMKYSAHKMEEALVSQVSAMPDAMRPEALRGLSTVEIENAIEHMNEETYKSVVAVRDEVYDNAKYEQSTISGWVHNEYIGAKSDGSGKKQLVSSRTFEDNAKVWIVTFADGSQATFKHSCLFQRVGQEVVINNETYVPKAFAELPQVDPEPTPTPTPEPEPTPTPTPEPEPTPTPTPDPEPTPTPTPEPEPTPTPTPEPEPTPTPTPEPEPTPTPTPDPEPTPTPTPEPEPTPTPTPEPEPTPTPTPEPEPTPTPTPEPEPTPTPTPEPEPTPTPTPEPEPTPTPTPEPEPEPEPKNPEATAERESDDYVTPLPLDEQETPGTERPVIEGFDQETGEFKDDEVALKDDEVALKDDEVTPKPEDQPANEQTTVTDTSQESADGSGRTIKEVNEEADSARETVERIYEEEAAKMAEEAAGRAEKEAAGEAAAEVRQGIEESNEALEEARAEMGDEGFRESEANQAQESQDAADFANGAFDLG